MVDSAELDKLTKSVLLRTKITVPRPRTCLIPRPRLTSQLDQVSAGSLVLISAPAGFGKTTLVTEWAAGLSGRIGWLALDEGDNSPVRFWRYLLAALQSVAQDLGQGVDRLLDKEPEPHWEPLIALLANDISHLESPVSLVLDDYHFIHANAIHYSLGFLLQHQPQQLRVILLTRADPPLALARLRVQGRLLEIRAADLRFTPAEMEAFFDCTLASSLPPAAMKTLADRIEGWAAGLQLAALTLRDLQAAEMRRFVADFSGAQRYVLNYLLEEVLSHQEPRIQSFLLETSILRNLNPDLCEHVTGLADSAQILARLADEELFVQPLDEAGLWYRYHRLFAGALRSRLEQTSPELIPELRHRAATWHAEKGVSETLPPLIRSAQLGKVHAESGEADGYLADQLTVREAEILLLIAKGYSNQQIADQLVISVGTVKGHVNHLLSKLNAQSRTEAVARAQHLGLLNL